MNKKKISRPPNRKNEIGIAYIKATFNNTIVTITNGYGNVIAWSSGGSCGFKGARKSTPFAARTAGLEVGKKSGFKKLRVIISGPGPGKENAIRGLKLAEIQIGVIKDKTTVPHNGCRPPKRRRV